MRAARGFDAYATAYILDTFGETFDDKSDEDKQGIIDLKLEEIDATIEELTNIIRQSEGIAASLYKRRRALRKSRPSA